MPTVAAHIPGLAASSEAIRTFCEKWHVARLALFGSVLREDFRPDSDIDVLVTFLPEATTDLFDLMEMEQELAAIFGRKVDLVSSRAIEQSRNWLRRREILGSAQTIYAR